MALCSILRWLYTLLRRPPPRSPDGGQVTGRAHRSRPRPVPRDGCSSSRIRVCLVGGHRLRCSPGVWPWALPPHGRIGRRPGGGSGVRREGCRPVPSQGRRGCHRWRWPQPSGVRRPRSRPSGRRSPASRPFRRFDVPHRIADHHARCVRRRAQLFSAPPAAGPVPVWTPRRRRCCRSWPARAGDHVP